MGYRSNEEHIVRRPSKAKVVLSWTSKEFDVANEYWQRISYRTESSTVRSSGCRAHVLDTGYRTSSISFPLFSSWMVTREMYSE
jgi:hypothetical protein